MNIPAPADRTDTWYRQLEGPLQAQGLTGLTEDIRLAVVRPEASLQMQPAPARLLHVLHESPEAFPLTAAGYEEDTQPARGSRATRRMSFSGTSSVAPGQSIKNAISSSARGETCTDMGCVCPCRIAPVSPAAVFYAQPLLLFRYGPGKITHLIKPSPKNISFINHSYHVCKGN